MLRPVLTLSLVLALTACGSDPEIPTPNTTADAATDAAPTGSEEVQGQLISGDLTLNTGEFYDAHELTAREGQWITTEVISGDFDPYFIVISPTGVQYEVDDSQRGNTSATRADVRAAESGEWQIVVTTYEPGESGNYSLTFEVVDERPADAQEIQPANAEAEDTSV